jgi:hypothetical protein
MAAHRVPGDGDSAYVDAAGEPRHGGLDEIEVVQDRGEVLHARLPVRARVGRGPRQPQGLRAEVGGLDNHEPVRRPEV